MGLIVKDNGGGDFEKAPSGMHIARCYMVAELGPQKSTWNDEVKWLQQVRLSFELPNALMTTGEYAGQPFSVSNNYTLSLGKKANLRRDLEGWRNRAFTDTELGGFDLHMVIGVPCMINVVHHESNGTVYANIASISPVMQGMACPPAVNKPVVFSIADSTPETFAALPEWLRNKINLEVPQEPRNAGNTQAEYNQTAQEHPMASQHVQHNPQEVYRQAGANNHQQIHQAQPPVNDFTDDIIPF